jgi:hypothetical protein
MHYSAWNIRDTRISILKFSILKLQTELSKREVMLSGFANAEIKPEGSAVVFDNAQETFTARYTHNTVALAFAITEEAIEDNLYDRLASRYTKALARSMANTKQVTAANVLNNGFSTSYVGGDGVSLNKLITPNYCWFIQ